MNRAPYAIALDVGGTSIKSGVITTDAAVVRQRTQTPVDSTGSAERILATFAEVARGHLREMEGAPLRGLALAFPGPFEYDTGFCRIRGVEKYESLFGINVGDALRQRLDLGDRPIRFRNDAEAAIVGECLYGAGQGYGRVIGVTLGTGFGSAFVIHGDPQTAGDGVPPNGWLYPHPVGAVRADDYFSARGLRRRLEEAGELPVDPKEAAEVARQGDERSGEVFATYGRELGSFLAPFAIEFRAEMVIVLGGIAEAFDLFGPALQDLLAIPVLPGEKGSDAAMLGAVQVLMGKPPE